MTQDDRKYTDPELRQRLKDEIQAGDRGGRKGQWSARKAQLLVQEYERHGGSYTGELDDTQQHLKDWGEQDWHTASGDADAGHGEKRYLPEVAWQLLTPAERRATDDVKHAADEQHVPNTDAAREARKAAELLTMTATEAARAVRRMDGERQLERARRAEAEHGKGRKTVLSAIDARLRSA